MNFTLLQNAIYTFIRIAATTIILTTKTTYGFAAERERKMRELKIK